jgi:hypothetical protein
MSMPALRSHPWTIEEVERLIDEREGRTPRYELADAELLVSPSPTLHGRGPGESAPIALVMPLTTPSIPRSCDPTALTGQTGSTRRADLHIAAKTGLSSA